MEYWNHNTGADEVRSLYLTTSFRARSIPQSLGPRPLAAKCFRGSTPQFASFHVDNHPLAGYHYPLRARTSHAVRLVSDDSFQSHSPAIRLVADDVRRTQSQSHAPHIGQDDGTTRPAPQFRRSPLPSHRFERSGFAKFRPHTSPSTRPQVSCAVPQSPHSGVGPWATNSRPTTAQQRTQSQESDQVHQVQIPAASLAAAPPPSPVVQGTTGVGPASSLLHASRSPSEVDPDRPSHSPNNTFNNHTTTRTPTTQSRPFVMVGRPHHLLHHHHATFSIAPHVQHQPQHHQQHHTTFSIPPHKEQDADASRPEHQPSSRRTSVSPTTSRASSPEHAATTSRPSSPEHAAQRSPTPVQKGASSTRFVPPPPTPSLRTRRKLLPPQLHSVSSSPRSISSQTPNHHSTADSPSDPHPSSSFPEAHTALHTHTGASTGVGAAQEPAHHVDVPVSPPSPHSTAAHTRIPHTRPSTSGGFAPSTSESQAQRPRTSTDTQSSRAHRNRHRLATRDAQAGGGVQQDRYLDESSSWAKRSSLTIRSPSPSHDRSLSPTPAQRSQSSPKASLCKNEHSQLPTLEDLPPSLDMQLPCWGQLTPSQRSHFREHHAGRSAGHQRMSRQGVIHQIMKMSSRPRQGLDQSILKCSKMEPFDRDDAVLSSEDVANMQDFVANILAGQGKRDRRRKGGPERERQWPGLLPDSPSCKDKTDRTSHLVYSDGSGDERSGTFKSAVSTQGRSRDQARDGSRYKRSVAAVQRVKMEHAGGHRYQVPSPELSKWDDLHDDSTLSPYQGSSSPVSGVAPAPAGKERQRDRGPRFFPYGSAGDPAGSAKDAQNSMFITASTAQGALPPAE